MGSSKSSGSEHRPNVYDNNYCACGLPWAHVDIIDEAKLNDRWDTLMPKEKEDEEKMKTAFWTIAALCLLGTWIVGTILAVIAFIVWLVS